MGGLSKSFLFCDTGKSWLAFQLIPLYGWNLLTRMIQHQLHNHPPVHNQRALQQR
jgi:hypothetical protein